MVTAPRGTAPPSRPIRSLRERGYNLVFLVCLVTFLSIALTAALPLIEQQVQREREAELIFRGLQIAEGLRLFQQRFGRYPTSLEEMVETEPRSLRQLWKDPMTDDGNWAYVLASAGAQGGETDGEGEDGDPTLGTDIASGSAPQSGFELPESQFGTPQTRGPILGVVSRSKKASVRSFMGKDRYSEWRFTATMIPKPVLVPGADIVARANVEWLGRGFPPGVEPQPGTGLGGEPADLGEAGGLSDLFEDDEDEDGQ